LTQCRRLTRHLPPTGIKKFAEDAEELKSLLKAKLQ